MMTLLHESLPALNLSSSTIDELSKRDVLLGLVQADLQSVYKAWLSRQYSIFTAHLLQLVKRSAQPAVQVAMNKPCASKKPTGLCQDCADQQDHVLLKSRVCHSKVAAVAALMEGARGCEGSGKFNNHMYERLVEALLGNSGAATEALSYLITQFLPFADVR